MRTIELNNGARYECDWGNGDKGILHLNLITDADFISLAMVFSNPDNTSRIVDHVHGNVERVYEGYTILKSIAYDSWRTGTVLITMLQPNQQIVE